MNATSVYVTRLSLCTHKYWYVVYSNLSLKLYIYVLFKYLGICPKTKRPETKKLYTQRSTRKEKGPTKILSWIIKNWCDASNHNIKSHARKTKIWQQRFARISLSNVHQENLPLWKTKGRARYITRHQRYCILTALSNGSQSNNAFIQHVGNESTFDLHVQRNLTWFHLSYMWKCTISAYVSNKGKEVEITGQKTIKKFRILSKPMAIMNKIPWNIRYQKKWMENTYSIRRRERKVNSAVMSNLQRSANQIILNQHKHWAHQSH